ncbi:hypothetical protein TNCV_2653931 [Trichonephila clavipes]|nr:hypothetical protein TNCV_2653931 [Trichonephila clavipes]
MKNVLSGIFDALTPGHFLVGRPVIAITEPSLFEVSDNRTIIIQSLLPVDMQRNSLLFEELSGSYDENERGYHPCFQTSVMKQRWEPEDILCPKSHFVLSAELIR